MSKSQEASNVFATCQHNVDSCFADVEKAIPIYNQAVTGLQQEYVQAFENAAETVISLQKEFASRTGLTVDIPDAALNIIKDVNKQIVKTYSVQNQVALAAVKATKQNVKSLNDNSKTFAELNKNIIQSWIQSFTSSTYKN